jgi:hypothetical protein
MGGPVGAAAGAMGGTALEDTLKPKAIKAEKLDKSMAIVKDILSKINDEDVNKEWQAVEDYISKVSALAGLASSAASDPKGFGEGVKSAGEGIKSAAEGVAAIKNPGFPKMDKAVMDPVDGKAIPKVDAKAEGQAAINNPTNANVPALGKSKKDTSY